MLSEQITEIRGRIERTGIGLKDAVSIMEILSQTQAQGPENGSLHEAFTALNKFIDLTVHGAKIERFRPRDHRHPFHTLEIHAEEGEILGYLNMIHLKRRLPCYYLVYVEVMPPFRGLGLGSRILRAFMEFVKEKKAVALLDNIIPPEEATYEIYTKLGWRRIKDLIGNGRPDGWENYMVFIPEAIQTRDLKDRLVKSLFNLSKKRPVIDMHDNEDMVKRAIQEFRSIYQALEKLYHAELSSGTSNPLMRFMFTRLTTKLIGFRRRIAELIGYTGGESLGQISFSEGINELPVQPYSLWNLGEGQVRRWGEEELLCHLPERLKEEPTLFIENLSIYQRPYLHDWMGKKRKQLPSSLKISDLLDLGFDPTRLREFHHEGVDYIFERTSPHLIPSLLKKKQFLEKNEKYFHGLKFRGATLRTNPPLAIFQDRGNFYVLRKKVEGIHLQEALDQLRTASHLREMNDAAGIDCTLLGTRNEVKHYLETKFKSRFQREVEDLAYFLPWDIERNLPRVDVGISGISLETIWLA